MIAPSFFDYYLPKTTLLSKEAFSFAMSSVAVAASIGVARLFDHNGDVVWNGIWHSLNNFVGNVFHHWNGYLLDNCVWLWYWNGFVNGDGDWLRDGDGMRDWHVNNSGWLNVGCGVSVTTTITFTSLEETFSLSVSESTSMTMSISSMKDPDRTSMSIPTPISTTKA